MKLQVGGRDSPDQPRLQIGHTCRPFNAGADLLAIGPASFAVWIFRSLFCWHSIPLRRNLACWCILPPKMNRVFYITGRATVRGSLGLQASGVSTGLWNKLCWESLMPWMSWRISQPRPTAGIGGHLCTGYVNLLWLLCLLTGMLMSIKLCLVAAKQFIRNG